MGEAIKGLPKQIPFEQFKKNAKKPDDVSNKVWQTGLAITEALSALGTQVHEVKDSVYQTPIANKYLVGGIIVGYMPTWGYVELQTSSKRHEPLFLNAENEPLEDVVERVICRIEDLTPSMKPRNTVEK